MTDETERTFSERVVAWCREWATSVGTNVYLSETGRYADVIARTPPCVFTIEVENDFEACFKGASQAAVYAESYGTEKLSMPLVIVPDGHIDEPERAQIERRTGVPIKTPSELGF